MIGLAIVAIFIFFSVSGGEKKQNSTIDEYVESLENKLKSCLTKVKGAGKVDVIISIESGMETVLATEKTESGGVIVESPVLVNGKTVVLKESYPEIVGVVIVSQGANNLSVKIALLNAACVYLDIPENKIEILTMK